MSTPSGRRAPDERPRLRSARLPSARWWVRWLAALAALYLAVLVLGWGLVEVAGGIDRQLFRWINQFGPGPDIVWFLLNPHLRNYALIVVVGAVAAALARRPPVLVAVAAIGLAGLLALGLLDAVYLAWDRPRPEEVLPASAVNLGPDSYAGIESYPSGHMAVTTGLAAMAWLLVPRLRIALVLYVAAVGVSRILFGSHFPLDVVGGILLGYGAAWLVLALGRETRLLRAPRSYAMRRRRATRPTATPTATPSSAPTRTSRG